MLQSCITITQTQNWVQPEQEEVLYLYDNEKSLTAPVLNIDKYHWNQDSSILTVHYHMYNLSTGGYEERQDILRDAKGRYSVQPLKRYYK